MNNDSDTYSPSPPRNQAEAASDSNPSDDPIGNPPTPILVLLDESFGHPGNNETSNLSPGVPYTATDDRSSVVRDGGNSSILSRNTPVKPPRNVRDDLFLSIGSHLDIPIEAPTLIEEDLEGSQPKDLMNLIFDEMKGPKNKPFLPNDKRDEIITFSNIKSELRRVELEPNVESIAADVWDIVTLKRDGKTENTSRRVIFTILCMVNRASVIQDFIEEQLYDYDLPFVFTNSAGDAYYQTLSGTKTPINLFKMPSWDNLGRQAFERNQGGIYPTLFTLSYPPESIVREYRLKDGVVLPFLEDQVHDAVEGVSYESYIRFGGFSVVRRVQIHDAHYQPHLNIPLDKPVYFAVKELHIGEAEFTDGREAVRNDREAAALKRLNTVNHTHLIRLLATYVQGGRVHMIFPWADGNLEKLWRDVPKPTLESFKSPHRARWMSQQILGLARGLKEIHYCKVDLTNKQEPGSLKDFGRHGDLKPQNILWFAEDKSNEGVTKDVLKIADFGFADFRSQHSKSNVRTSTVVGTTPTYEAPEFSTTKKVSQHYDIWSFGCILLQFAVWYLEGWGGIEEFSLRRAREQKVGPFSHDNFFTYVSLQPLTVQMKKSVFEEFEQSKKHEECTDYILDLLEYVQNSMLKMDPNKRADIKDIVNHFEQLNKRCQESAYCTGKIRQHVARSGTILSQIAEEIEPRIPAPVMFQIDSENTDPRRSQAAINRSRQDPKRQGSRSSFEQHRNNSPGRPKSPLLQQPYLAATASAFPGADEQDDGNIFFGSRNHPPANSGIAEENLSVLNEASNNNQDTNSEHERDLVQDVLPISDQATTGDLREAKLDNVTPQHNSFETDPPPAERPEHDNPNPEIPEHHETVPTTHLSRNPDSREHNPENTQPELNSLPREQNFGNGHPPTANGHTVPPTRLIPANGPKKPSRRRRAVLWLEVKFPKWIRQVLCIGNDER